MGYQFVSEEHAAESHRAVVVGGREESDPVEEGSDQQEVATRDVYHVLPHAGNNGQKERHDDEGLGSGNHLQEGSLPQQRADVIVQVIVIDVNDHGREDAVEFRPVVGRKDVERAHAPYHRRKGRMAYTS